MATSENQQHYPNPAPPSLSAGGHETRDYYAAQKAPRPSTQDEPYLTPYLGLRARLSQTWINRWTILLLLVLVRTLFAIASLDDNLGSARREALSMCTSVENVGSAMASMPHYMSQGVNQMTAKGIEKAIDGLMQGLILIVAGVEQIIVFVINLLTSTYLCLITLAVSGSLHVAISVAEDVGDFLNSTIKGVGKELGDATGGFTKAMNGFMADVDKVASVLTSKTLTPPTIDLSSEIATLDGLQLPTDYDQGLQKLNSSIPTFEQVKNFTDSIIEFPFEEVKKLLNASLPRYTMNHSLFPVPAKKQLTFCSDNNGVNQFFDDLVAIERMARKVFLIVIVIAAILAMVPMAYRELRRYRFMQQRVVMVQSDARDPLDAVYIVSRPYTSATGIWLANRFPASSSSRLKVLIRWSVAYATTVPALFVLSLALAGLLSCLCQYILLKAIEKEVPALENMVISFADKVIDSLNEASQQWAVGTNKVINNTNAAVNHDLLGWVNTTTTAVNSTLVAFVDETVHVLNVTFGGTVLYQPILDVLNCLVLLKIQGIEKGLTWVHDHAHVDFPLLDNDTFSLGTLQKVSGSSTDLLATGPNGTAADAISNAVDHVIVAVAKTIRQEAIISTCVLLIWVMIAMIGLGRSVFLYFRGGGHVPATAAAGHNPFASRGGGGDDHPDDLSLTGLRPYPRPPGSSGSGATLVATSSGGMKEKYPQQHELELDDLRPSTAPVPTYEQATATAITPTTTTTRGRETLPPGDNHANRFHGQSYTLTPAPMPTFTTSTAAAAAASQISSPHRPVVVDVTAATAATTAIRRPTHVRESSHGDYDLTSPVSPLVASSTSNPFANPVATHPTANPFLGPEEARRAARR